MQKTNNLRRLQWSDLFLVGIVTLGATLRFWGLPSLELQSDGAHYAFRALGWFDFLSANTQTSPVVWFDQIPWWGFLSFHDHPPFGFFVQHWFLRLLGDTTAHAILPYLLGGIVNIVLIYRIVEKHGTRKQALVSSFLTAILSYAIWIDRSGYLEGLEIPLILGSIYFFLAYATKNRARDLYLCAIMTGFALLTKYTALFLLPAYASYLLLKRYKVGIKKISVSVLLLSAVLLPVIIYNIMVFATRGHFDAALSSLVGMHPVDFVGISDRVANLDLIDNGRSILVSLVRTISLPLLFLFFLTFGQTLLRALYRRADTLDHIALLGTGWLIAMFSISGVAERHLAVIIPFLCIFVGRRAVEFIQSNSKTSRKILTVAALIAVCIVELFYSINTNLVLRPIGLSGITFSQIKMYRQGFQELDAYLRSKILLPLPSVKKIGSKNDTAVDFKTIGDTAIVVDQRVDWFPMMWYMERYRFYYDKPLYPMHDLFSFAAAAKHDPNVFSFLKDNGVKNIWFVYTYERIQNGSPVYDKYTEGVYAFLKSQHIEPVKIINDYRGEPVFEVFYFHI